MLKFGAATQPLVGLASEGGLLVNETGTVVLFDHRGIVAAVLHSGSQQAAT
jgi:hypothetical protein